MLPLCRCTRDGNGGGNGRSNGGTGCGSKSRRDLRRALNVRFAFVRQVLRM